MAQIQNMRISHEMILNWLILNPEKTQNECAELFGVTAAWLSTVINSDCFQARWAERKMHLADGTERLATAKMRAVVDKGLERLERMVEVVPDPKFVLDTTDKLLARLGYGPKTGAGIGQQNVQINNTFQVSRDVLAAARGEITAQGEALSAQAQGQLGVQVEAIDCQDNADDALPVELLPPARE